MNFAICQIRGRNFRLMSDSNYKKILKFPLFLSKKMDHFLVRCFRAENGTRWRYPHLKQFFKSALLLSRANNDAERSFSTNVKVLTNDCCEMSGEMSGIRVGKEALLFQDALTTRSENLPLTKELSINVFSSFILQTKIDAQEEKQRTIKKEDLLWRCCDCRRKNWDLKICV